MASACKLLCFVLDVMSIVQSGQEIMKLLYAPHDFLYGQLIKDLGDCL